MTDKTSPSSANSPATTPSSARAIWHRIKRAAVLLWCVFIIALVVVGDTVMRLVL